MISVGSVLFYSHGYRGTERADGWIMFSSDSAQTWWPWRQLDPGAFGYSGLTLLGQNATHVKLGAVWEGDGGIRWGVVEDLIPTGDSKLTSL